METLFNIEELKQYPQLMLADKVRKWFQENGTLPFEHGFKSKIFTIAGLKMRVTMCDVNGVHIFAKLNNGAYHTFSWSRLRKQTILAILRECNRYYDYVMKNA